MRNIKWFATAAAGALILAGVANSSAKAFVPKVNQIHNERERFADDFFLCSQHLLDSRRKVLPAIARNMAAHSQFSADLAIGWAPRVQFWVRKASPRKPLGDLAWAYFKRRPEWRKVKKDPEFHITANL
jgi:hypothetical protein